ncbi:WxL domain-containing protein [Enterococcus casseliflavus]|uniref:WxL domain-containing protein n=1 Tax=Enterococcus casseliflavus TaxID=37734 RepID=UPI0023D98240|nr:WxL domain-containing protein [Enterococcus casseliflavus]WEL46904.1 WxL domain-containing protein [Enterococcus casseliflavus]
MKRIYLATISIMSIAVLSGGVTAAATPILQGNTENEVDFIPGEEEEIDVELPEKEPEVEIDPIDPEVTGPFTLVHVPKRFDFGTQVISTGPGKSAMLAELERLSDGSGTAPYVSFAQVLDTRGGHSGWTLNVDLDQFTSTDATLNHKLRGAYIEFQNPQIRSNALDPATFPTAPSDQFNHQTIDVGTEGNTLMSAAPGQGAGLSTVQWGDQTLLNQQHAAGEEDILNEAIWLHIPTGANPQATAYTATLTWHLSAIPGN